MRIAALGFCIYFILVLISIASAFIIKSPDNTVDFVLVFSIVFGMIGSFALASAWQIWRNKNLGFGYTFIAILTMIIFIGWAKNSSSFELKEPLHPVMNFLRTTMGLCTFCLWPVLIRASILKSKEPINQPHS